MSNPMTLDAALERMARAYMRLQCADVPRDPWHWEVCKILNETGSPSRDKNLSLPSALSDKEEHP